MKHILVFGTFDNLHPGHRFLLDYAQQKGELHIVVARDATVQRIKNKMPDQNENDRISKIQHAYPDAKVHLGNENDYFEPVRNIEPDAIILWYDQKMPPGVSEEDLPCVVERCDAFHPEKYKSSLRSP